MDLFIEKIRPLICPGKTWAIRVLDSLEIDPGQTVAQVRRRLQARPTDLVLVNDEPADDSYVILSEDRVEFVPPSYKG